MNLGSSETGSFAAEFEKLFGGSDNVFRPGKIVKGRVVGVNREMVTIDIGFKSDGVVSTQQFKNSEGKIEVAIGDETDVYILSLENDEGEVVLSKERADQMRVWKEVEDLFSKNGIVKGKVVQKVKGGLQVDIGIPAFLPGSQVDIRPHRNLDKFIGEEHEFRVLKITRDKGNIVLSRRAVLMDERDSLRSETLKVLTEGVIMEGTVKNLTEYGAFIDLGGIDGLLHITDISWGRVNHPADRLSVGQKLPVVVLKYDQEKERVSLGLKQLTKDPWTAVSEKFPIGGRTGGKVVNLTDYGAFVELEEGVEGLIHVSEMSWGRKVRNPSQLLSVGQEVESVILGIDADERRISLGLKQLTPNPWEAIAERFPRGAKVKGTVRSITQYGMFVEVEEGVDGRVHLSDFSWTKRFKDPKEIEELYNKGQEIEVVVLEIDPATEKLSLGIKQLETDPWDNLVQRYPQGSRVTGKVASIAKIGVFVELEPGIDGLVHWSQLNLEKGQDISAVYKEGDSIEIVVIGIDRPERKISLSVKALHGGTDRDDRDNSSGYTEDTGIGVTFGDLIKDKLDSEER